MLPRPRLCLLALLVPWTLTCSDDQGGAAQLDSTLVDEAGRPSVGQFENRGHKYNLHDLMDPQFRATHADPYVQEFDPDVYFGIDASTTTYRIELRSYRRKIGKRRVNTWQQIRIQFDEVPMMQQPLPGRPDPSPQSTKP